MDAISDPAAETVVIMSSSQIGKSESILNMVGYHIDHDPAPIMVVMPTERDAETWSKDRFSPMARDTPCLQGKIADPRSRDGNNKILHKRFPGGHLTIVGANAPSGLASRPIRLLLCDEVDRYPFSAGAEGDPVNLARKRTVTFWNRKIVLVSTPTNKGASRIEAAFEESDQRRFWVPCPTCGAEQLLTWGQVKWDKDENGGHRPETARYHCVECDAAWRDETPADAGLSAFAPQNNCRVRCRVGDLSEGQQAKRRTRNGLSTSVLASETRWKPRCGSTRL